MRFHLHRLDLPAPAQDFIDFLVEQQHPIPT